MEDKKKPKNINEEMVDLLYHAMKGLDEMRGKTLIYSKFRDTQVLADRISSLLRRVKKKDNEGLELKEVWIEKGAEEEIQQNQKPLVREIE